MIIRWDKEQNFTLKAKTLTAKIGDKNILGELVIDTPGEYEVAGVQMEIIDGINQVFAEGLNIGHMRKAKILSDDELGKLNGIDILLIGIGGGKFTETKTALQVISQIEPAIVIPMYSQGLEEFSKEEGVATEGKDELKIARAELPQEERQVVILNPSHA
jgi:hypothetical protein